MPINPIPIIKNQNKLVVVPLSRKYGKAKPKIATPKVVQINQILRPTISIYLPEIAIVMANEIALHINKAVKICGEKPNPIA